MRNLLLDVSRGLKAPGQSFPFSATLSLPEMTVLDDQLVFSQIQVEGAFTGAGESVSLTGQVRAQVHAHCARCAAALEQPIQASFDQVFVKSPDPQDPDLFPLDGHTVDLTPMVQEALLLELPMRFLCRPDCQGLCPVCGANRNRRAARRCPIPFRHCERCSQRMRRCNHGRTERKNF